MGPGPSLIGETPEERAMAKDVPDLIYRRMLEVGIPRERKPELVAS